MPEQATLEKTTLPAPTQSFDNSNTFLIWFWIKGMYLIGAGQFTVGGK